VRTRGLTILALTAVGCAGCGGQATSAGSGGPKGASAAPASAANSADPVAVAHPQAVEPVAGAAPATASNGPGTAPQAAGVSVQASGGASSLPQPTSLAEVRRQLAESGMPPSTTRATLTPGGLAVAPIDAPAAVQAVIAAGNEIARLPYRYGGGHMTYEDTAYDCSGSISYVFAAAHLLSQTVTSGELESWGDPGPGKWITVFANAGHTFMYVAGLRFDTVALAETGSRWSDRPATEGDLSSFSVRHPPGL
jgi:cell wall-associated NlpC family hydrolase